MSGEHDGSSITYGAGGSDKRPVVISGVSASNSKVFVGVAEVKGDLVWQVPKDEFTEKEYGLVRPGLSRVRSTTDVSKILGKIGGWLQAPTYETDLGRHGDKIIGRDSNPGVWLSKLEEFVTWKAGVHHRLWISGRPGCGKSVIASSVISDLLDQHANSNSPTASETFVGYAFGSKTDDAKQVATGLLRGILWQLATWKPLNLDQKLEIASDFSSTGARSIYSSNYHADDTVGPLLRILRNWLGLFKHAFLVFDGLDECEGVETLLESIICLDAKPTKLNLLFVSQPTGAISRVLKSKSLTVDMDAAKARSHTEIDIQSYVRSEITKHGDEFTTIQVDAISREIVRRSDGMFLWAVFATAELTSRLISFEHTLDSDINPGFQDLVLSDRETADANHDLDQSNLIMSINQLPRQMDSLFLYLLKRILRPDSQVSDTQNDRKRNTILALLRWVFHSRRPMTLTELHIAMGLPQHFHEDPGLKLSMSATTPNIAALKKLTQLCYPIVSLQDNKAVLLHATFKEFIQTDATAFSNEVVNVLGSEKLDIAIIDKCLTYLEGDQFDFLDFIAVPRTEIQQRYPFLEYACTSWVPLLIARHPIPSEIESRIIEFLKSDNAISWVENWREFSDGDFSFLQSSLYLSLCTVKHQTWILDLLTRCVEERKSHDATTDQTTNMALALSRLYKNVGRYQDAYNEFLFVHNVRKTQFTEDSIDLLSLRNELGGILCELGRLGEALQCYEEIYPRYREMFGLEDERCLVVRSNIAYACSHQGNYTKAEAIYRDCYSIRQRTQGQRSAKTLDSATDLVHVLRHVGKLHEAKKLCLQIEKISIEDEGRASYRAVRLGEAAALLEMDLDNMAEALRRQRLVVEARIQTLGPDHQSTMRSKNNLATILETLAKFEEAGDILQELVPAFQALTGPKHSMTLTAMNNLATNLEHQGRNREALDLYQDILKIQTEQVGRTHPDALLAMNNTANFFLAHGPVAGAASLLAEAFNSALDTLGLSSSLTRVLLSNLTSLSVTENRLASSEYFNTVHRELLIAAFGEKHSDFIDAELMHIAVLRRQGLWTEAEKIIQRCLQITKKQQGTHSEKHLALLLQKAGFLRDRGFFKDAEKIIAEVVAAKEVKHGMGHRFTLQSRMLLGVVYTKQGMIEQASELLTVVYKDMCDWTGADSGKAIGCSVNIAEVNRRRGKLHEAEAILRTALTYYVDTYGPQYDDTMLIQERLGLVLYDLENFAEAEEIQKLALAGRRVEVAPTHPAIASCQADLARTLFKLGKVSEAASILPAALDRMKHFWSTEYPKVEKAEETLGWIQKAAPDLISTGSKSPVATPAADSFYVVAHREIAKLLGADNRLSLRLEAKVAMHWRSHGTTQATKSMLTDAFERQSRLLGNEDLDTLTTLDEMIQDLDATSFETEMLRPCLTWAINSKNVALLRRLVENGALLSSRDAATSYTPLALSIHTDQIECMNVLLEHGADVNSVEHDSERAIHVAARKGSLPMINKLLEYGANVDACSEQGLTALYIACETGNFDLVKRLLKAGAGAHLTFNGLYPLHIAAARADIQIMDSLLDAKADIECKFNGGSPLHLAVVQNQLEAVKYLHQRGALLDVSDNAELTPLHDACQRGHLTIVQFLLENGGYLKKHSQAGLLPIHSAIESGSISILEALSRSGADIGAYTSTGYHLTPLATAASQGKDEIVQWLLDQGVDPNEKLGDDITALFFAAHFGFVNIIQKLISAGADVNARTTDGQQALHEAVVKSDAAAAAALIEAGADASGVLANGAPFLAFAVVTRREGLIDALLKGPGINVNASMSNGLSALQLACYLELPSVVTKLLNHGADVNCLVLSQETPLHQACAFRRYDVINILLQRGADTTLRNFAGRRPIDYASEDERICAWFGCSPAPFTLGAVHYEALHRSLLHFAKEGRVTSDAMKRTALFGALARSLMDLGSIEDARIALEQCITVSSEDRSTFENDAMCNMCPSTNTDDVTGTAYFCTSCSQATALCGDCMAKYGDTEHPRWCQGHTFVSVPRDIWKTLQPGAVDEHGQTVEQWLERLEERFRTKAMT